MTCWPSVIVATPAHSGVGTALTYRSETVLAPGTLVRVPLGSREVLGVVWDCPNTPPEGLSEAQTKAVAGTLAGLSPLNARWRQLVAFAAHYYQRSPGEVALAALIALVLLDEYLSVLQWVAIGLIIAASMGSALTARRVPGGAVAQPQVG